MASSILLVEDHAAFRQALAFLIEAEPEFAVVSQAGTMAEAYAAAGDGFQGIDVAVVDIGLPDGDGVELIRDLSGKGVIVLVLTASVSRADFARSVEAGASGIIHKSVAVNEVVSAVRRLRDGEALLSPVETIEMLREASRDRQKNQDARSSFERLTNRERDVLEALAEGLDSDEIARKLHITVETERTHVVNILTKLGVHSRLQALVFTARHGFIKIQ